MQPARVGKRGAIVVPAKLRNGLVLKKAHRDCRGNRRRNSCCPTLSKRRITASPKRGSEAGPRSRLDCAPATCLNGPAVPRCQRSLLRWLPTQCRTASALEAQRCRTVHFPLCHGGSEDQPFRRRAASAAQHVFRIDFSVDAGSGVLPRVISLPEKDAPILLAAIAADATHLLTGEVRHFGPHFGKKIEGTTIVPPGNYLHCGLVSGEVVYPPIGTFTPAVFANCLASS